MGRLDGMLRHDGFGSRFDRRDHIARLPTVAAQITAGMTAAHTVVPTTRVGG